MAARRLHLEQDCKAKGSEYETVLASIGSFGRYQIRVFVLISMFETPAAWAMLLPILAGANPHWVCSVSVAHNASNETQDVWRSVQDNCAALSDGQSFDTFCNYTSDFTSIITEWNLICDKDYIPDLITSVQMIGLLIGAVITGQLADWFGRKKLLFITYSLLLIFWFASAFSSTWQIYAILRFFTGALVGGVLVVNFVLPLEFVTPDWRTFCGCVGFWAVGLMTLGIWGYFIREWRHLIIGTSVSGIFILLSYWLIPESPRWLLYHGRVKEAQDIIIAMAKFNNKPVPDLAALLQTSMNPGEKRKKYYYWQLCSSWRLTLCSFILMFAWYTSSSVYYGLSLNVKNLSGNKYLNIFLSGLVEIPALIFVLIVNNRIGRRKTVFILMMIAGSFCFLILILDLVGKLHEWPWTARAVAMVGKSGIAGGWAAVQVLSAEIFPTVVRNIGIGSCSMAARIGGIVAPQFVYLSKLAQAVPFTIFGCSTIICAVVILVLPETRAKPLPDMLTVPSYSQSDSNGDIPEQASLRMAKSNNDSLDNNVPNTTILPESGDMDLTNNVFSEQVY